MQCLSAAALVRVSASAEMTKYARSYGRPGVRILPFLVFIVINSLPAATPNVSVVDFVKQIYFHGVPFQEAAAYGPAAAPELINMLSDPSYEPYWSNVVVTLGIVGDSRVIRPMLKFLESGTGEIPAPIANAKSGVLMSLGYVINHTNDAGALDYLKSGLKPSTWDKRIKWRASYHLDTASRNRHLSMLAINGLALSGHPDALQVLQQLLATSAAASEERAFRRAIRRQVMEAIKINKFIAENGLPTYYKKMEGH